MRCSFCHGVVNYSGADWNCFRDCNRGVSRGKIYLIWVLLLLLLNFVNWVSLELLYIFVQSIRVSLFDLHVFHLLLLILLSTGVLLSFLTIHHNRSVVPEAKFGEASNRTEGFLNLSHLVMLDDYKIDESIISSKLGCRDVW